MRSFFNKYKESKFHKYVREHKKYAPITFFITGFIWDSLTLGRIDRLYDVVVLTSHITLLTISIFFFVRYDLNNHKSKFIDEYGLYLPLAIQFFLGGLSSAYVIYFSRSVSLSKTAAFFVLLMLLFIANEFLRKRISNKYLLFGFYLFVNFIFLTCFIPILLKQMNTFTFVLAGVLSLSTTLALLFSVFKANKNLKAELSKVKMIFLLVAVYAFINICYFLKLIPPVPLALDKGIVAYNITVRNNKYEVTYEVDEWYYFWRDHKVTFYKREGKPIYIFTSIFAPTQITQKVYHRWKRYNSTIEDWEITDNIGYEILGGRDNGYRGYTYKNNVTEGDWKVEVVNEDDLVLGVVDFTILEASKKPEKLITRKF